MQCSDRSWGLKEAQNIFRVSRKWIFSKLCGTQVVKESEEGSEEKDDPERMRQH